MAKAQSLSTCLCGRRYPKSYLSRRCLPFGLPQYTTYSPLVEYGHAQPGNLSLITAASSSVGYAPQFQIAKAQGSGDRDRAGPAKRNKCFPREGSRLCHCDEWGRLPTPGYGITSRAWGWFNFLSAVAGLSSETLQMLLRQPFFRVRRIKPW